MQDSAEDAALPSLEPSEEGHAAATNASRSARKRSGRSASVPASNEQPTPPAPGSANDDANDLTLSAIDPIDTTASAAELEEFSAAISALPRGFQVPAVTGLQDSPTVASEQDAAAVSPLSDQPALLFVELERLGGGEGEAFFYPAEAQLAVGDVLYLRQRGLGENGVIVQVIEIATANYPSADIKALWRLLSKIAALEIKRSHHEPPEVLDDVLSAKLKVRAAIKDGAWTMDRDSTVTRNVDIFFVSPSLLLAKVVRSELTLNLHIGDYKGIPVEIYGGALGLITAIVGGKGTGKSHLARGLISESWLCGISSVVTDVNNEHEFGPVIPTALTLALRPSENFLFRLDMVNVATLFRLLELGGGLAEKTHAAAYAKLPDLLNARIRIGGIPDLQYMASCSKQIIAGSGEVAENMRAAYLRCLENLASHHVVMSEAQALAEDDALRGGTPTRVASFRTAFQALFGPQQHVVVLKLAGLEQTLQRLVVSLLIDNLRGECDRQAMLHGRDPRFIPAYPAIVLEEAHEYLDAAQIDQTCAVIRHVGTPLFFVTNSPQALPSAVFRLLDNLMVAQLANESDIERVIDAGLADRATVQEFMKVLPEHHMLLLSTRGGATRNFPLLCKVRDFGLAPSGTTRSQWEAMRLG